MNKNIMVFIVVLAIAALTMATTLVAAPGCCMKNAAATMGCGMKKGADIVPETLCSKCGQIKGAEQCCKADAVKCPKCNLDKGSPGCCRLIPDK